MTWHNLPCAPTLHAIAAMCPRGWIEFDISHYAGDSGAGGNHPQEPETFADNRRVWGIDSDDQQELGQMWRRGEAEPWELGRGIPHGATVLARLERAPLVCNTCGKPCNPETMLCQTAKGEVDGERVGCAGLAIIKLALITTWGEGGKPVYWIGEGAPDYSGQQAAPAEAPGDMWAQIIARAEQHGVRPSLIERMRQRRQQGIENYGRPLAPHNGRDAVRDVMEESLDRLAFLEQLAEERPELQPVVGESQSDDLVLLTFLDQLVAAERSR